MSLVWSGHLLGWLKTTLFEPVTRILPMADGPEDRVVKARFSLVLHPKFANAEWNHWFSSAVFLNLELNVRFSSKAFGSHSKRV